MTEFKHPPTKWTTAINNGDFILVETWSGYRGPAYDPDGKQIYLPVDVEDTSLGQAVLEALSVSRVIDVKEIPIFFDYQKRQEIYKKWIESLMSRFGYKTKRALFKNMDECGIEVLDGKITLHPQHHEKLEAWGATENGTKDNVIIPADSSPEEIGAALRLAFARCTSSVS